MPDAPLFLGIDIGTSAAKAILIESSGKVAAVASAAYPLSTPRPLWSEQDPADWWRGTISSVRDVIEQAGCSAEQIASIGLTGQMHGLVLLDSAGEVLRPAILWNDQRTDSQCNAIHDRIGREKLIETTGKPALTGFTAGKILWVRDNEPEVYSRIASILLPKDYIRYKLTGEKHIDVADASGTNLLDIHTRQWSSDICQALDIPDSWLPEVFESIEPSAKVRADNEFGLTPGTIVIAGAGDQAAEGVGCGITAPGGVSVSVGTSGVVFAATNAPEIDPTGVIHTYCHALPGRWHNMGVMLSAGGSLSWFQKAIADRPYDDLLAQAAGVAAGSEGLVFLPYLTGERTPHADPNARGAFIGLTTRHTLAHMTRAVIEGIAFGLRDCLERIPRDAAPGPIRISGGATRHPLWRRVLADVLNKEVATINVSDGAAFGAAILASVAAGAFPSVVAAAESVVNEASNTPPGPDQALYARQFASYRSLYPALADSFHTIAALSKQ